ncbi:nucleotide exchange factor GrpE [Lactobacillus reuteri]|uniref:nucleotide exchange factor GrpE n=1 Tax=Limosilactobacillus reuteri TaxID=1598 RepID=UPI00146A04A2|nr:nucleotide exchange factor GrpE [Limosilactobacillus reuteri]NMV48931.1 nucleotide exchange factor GrpE [Limosilactobacillus reuteri]NMV50595.1 nucleotide exchange factor GrpE [Limosilactobacillus reuteri]NMV52437.1 nucleotide exchange factor GrpE [Limosilactobacillus reuteri]NMV53900.1 nucleotide exchange factor GrpE [Limosilactobacillus reuteri]NMV55408.1 nucleotide exchange factor GrpE [Limosilactobacillus reuteri]
MAKEKQEEQQKQTAPENEKAPKKDIKKEASDKKDDQTSKLKEEIADLKKQLADKDDKYLRAEAEIQNMTNRFNKERAQILKYDGQDLAKSILPVLDNLKRALAIEVVDDNGKQLKKGIQMVHDHLVKALNDHGITEIKSDGETFDPTLHQAVQTVPVEEGQKPETVVNVLQAGYQLKDRVLRPAMVVVAQ